MLSPMNNCCSSLFSSVNLRAWLEQKRLKCRTAKQLLHSKETVFQLHNTSSTFPIITWSVYHLNVVKICIMLSKSLIGYQNLLNVVLKRMISTLRQVFTYIFLISLSYLPPSLTIISKLEPHLLLMYFLTKAKVIF